MGDALRMPGGVSHRDHASTCVADQDEALEGQVVDDRLEVFDVPLERELDAFAIGKSAASPVIPNERVSPREEREPRAPDREVPIEFEMPHPVTEPDQRRTGAAGGIRKSYAISARAEADLLFRLGHRIPKATSQAILACSPARQCKGGEGV